MCRVLGSMFPVASSTLPSPALGNTLLEQQSSCDVGDRRLETVWMSRIRGGKKVGSWRNAREGSILSEEVVGAGNLGPTAPQIPHAHVLAVSV